MQEREVEKELVLKLRRCLNILRRCLRGLCSVARRLEEERRRRRMTMEITVAIEDETAMLMVMVKAVLDVRMEATMIETAVS